MPDDEKVSRTQELTSLLESKEEAKKFAKHLFHSLPQRDALQFGKRVNYVKGAKFTAGLTSTPEDGIKHSHRFFYGLSKEEIDIVGSALVRHGFMHASKIKNRAKRELQPVPLKMNPSGKLVDGFDDTLFYTWIYKPSSFKGYFMLGLIMFGFLSAVMYPIWPTVLKTGVWYISVTFLIALFIIIIVRIVVYLLMWQAGFEVWIFPNLFDDDASIVESFIPVLTMDKGDQSKEAWMSRGFCIAGTCWCIVWIISQPNDWDEIIAAQKEFVHDIYEGKLISDEEHQWYDVNGQDKSVFNRKVPKLEDLYKEIEEDDTEVEEVDVDAQADLEESGDAGEKVDL